MNRTQKEHEVAQLADAYKKATAVFLTDYSGLTVAQLTEVRGELRKVNARMKIIKNRLMLRAVADQEGELGFEGSLKGPTAITFVNEDPVGAAKVLAKYASQFDSLDIRGGVLRGGLLSAKDVEALSKLPSKEELYAKLLGTLLAPASNLARVLQAVPTKVVQVIAAIRDTKQ